MTVATRCQVTAYAEDVLSGRILAGELVRLAAQRHLDDLARADGVTLRWNQEEADAAIAFFTYLPQFQGRWDGKPLVLLPWEAFCVGCAFGWQIYDAVLGRWIRRFREVYVSVGRKNGKALALDTPIPTPNGWTTMGGLRVGDTVFDEQGQPCHVTAVTRVMREHDCYEVRFSDGSYIVADADHQWLTTARTDRPGKGGRGRRMNSLVRVRTTAEIAVTLTSSSRGDANHSIPVCEPLQCEPRDLPLAPYLLGAWLGDGHSAGALITTVDAEVLSAIRAEGVAVRGPNASGITYRLGNGDRRQVARNGSVQAKLRALGVLNNKHIPAVYQRASIQQRMALLRGLMDTDGYVSKAGSCEFTATSAALADGVLELTRGLGFKPTLTMGRAVLDGVDVGPKYTVRFWAYSDRLVFGLSRKQQRQRPAPAVAGRSHTRQIVRCRPVPSVPVRCIEVDSRAHLYLAGPAMIPTHNTTLAAGVGLWLLDFDHEPGAQVYCVATKRDQARQCFDAMVKVVSRSPVLRRRITHLSSTSRLVVRDTASYLAPLGRDSDSEHGLNPHGAIIDELHVHRTRDMVDAIETAIGARTQPLIWYITTAGVEGQSIYTETDDRARRVLRGVSPDDRMFCYLASLDDDDDWTDPAVYGKANPSLGQTIQLEELVAERDKALTTPGMQNSFKRLRLNMRTSQQTQWLDVNKWDEGLVSELLREGRRAIGVDFGGNTDFTAAAILTMDAEGGLDLDMRFWMPRDRVTIMEQRDGVPYEAWVAAGHIIATDGDWRNNPAILADLYALCGERDVRTVACDPHGNEYVAGELGDKGIEVVNVPQFFSNLAAATQHVENMLAKGALSHLGNPLMRYMIMNASVDEARDGSRKPSRWGALQHKKHIDGVSALVTGVARLLRMEQDRVIEGEISWL